MLLPKIRFVLHVGTGTLFVGLTLIGCAVGRELAENLLGRHELGDEVGDLDEPVKAY